MERKLAAIFALDMVSFSRLMGEDETGTLSRHQAHIKELLEPAITRHRGHIVKGTGDGLLVEFASAVDAVEAAAEIQREMPGREKDVPSDRRIIYRIGINVGDIVVEEGDIYGDGVNVAARIEALAEPGTVYISESAFNQVRNKVQLGFADLGKHSVKNIQEPVRVYEVLLDPALAGTMPGRRRRRRKKIPKEMLAAALVIVVLGGGLAIRDFLMRDTSERDARATRASALERLSEVEDPRRVAVLYFEPRTPQEEVPFIAAGLSETLIDELSGVETLKVVSRNGVAQFRDATLPPDSIGRALEVATIVNGTVSMADQDIRVSVSFVNAATGDQFGTTRVDGTYDQLFQLQDDLAQEVGSFLLRTLGEEIEEIELRAGTDNVEAWELVQRASPVEDRALAFMQTGEFDAALASLAVADSILALAEEIDPAWVEPTVRRGWLDYQASRFTGFSDRVAADGWIGRGLEDAEVAVQLDSADASALELRGTLAYWKYLLNLADGPAESERLVGDAESDLRASVASNPGQASAWSSLSHLLANQDRVPEAKVAALRSYEADPYLKNVHLTLWRLFGTSFDLGDVIEASRWCEEGRRRFPERPRFRQCEVWVNAMPDADPDIESVWAAIDAWAELSPPDRREFNEHQGQMLAALALAQAGMPDSARAVAERARLGSDVDPTRNIAFWEAVVRSFLGDMDEAITQWNVHVAANPDVTAEDHGYWYMEALRTDPRFSAP
jgi:class 3 adenylate cyclase/TolB-like protein